jgi:hypothetical protein
MKQIKIRTRKTTLRKIRTRRIGFVLSLLSVGMFLFPTLPAPMSVATGSKASVKEGRTSNPECPACAKSETSTIYAPLIQLAESSGTEMNLNCRSPHVMTVTPTFYTQKGGANRWG